MLSYSKILTALALATPLAAGQSPEKSTVPLPPVPEFETSDPAVHGKQIAAYADLRDSGWKDEVGQGRMTLFDAGGDSVTRTYVRMVRDGRDQGDKSLVRFLSPAEIKGVAALTHEHPGSSDDNWLYLPANKRVRRISGANKTASFQGTEFTYEDLSNLAVVEYEWRFMNRTEIERNGEVIPVLRVEARPLYEDTGYSRLIVHFHAEHWRRERVEYFDRSGQRLKTQELSGWRHFGERFWRSQTIEMTNHQTGKRTHLVNSKTFVDLSRYKSSKTGQPRKNLDDTPFTTQALQK